MSVWFIERITDTHRETCRIPRDRATLVPHSTHYQIIKWLPTFVRMEGGAARFCVYVSVLST
jgi:hypothetical protein